MEMNVANNPSVLDRFFKKLAFKEASDATVTTYRRQLHKLRLFIDAEFGLDIDRPDHITQVTGGMLEDFQTALKEQGASPATQQLVCAVVRAYFTWACKAGILEKNPADALVNIKVVHEEQSHLSWPQVEQLMATYRSRNQLRDLTIMAIGFTMAIRVGGIVGLNVGDVHVDTFTLTYRNKGGAKVTAYIPEPVMNMLREYIEEQRFYAADEDPLFVSEQGKRMSVDAVELMYKKAGEQMGVRITPHSARRSCLSRINELQGIEMARSIAHHSDSRMTERYIYSSPEAMSKLYKGMELFHGKDATSVTDVLADAQDEE